MKTDPALHIYFCGHEACIGGHSFGPASRQHYMLHFIIHGKGFIRADDKVLQVRENQAFLIRPGEITYYEADRVDPWEYVWVAFDGSQTEYLGQMYGIKRVYDFMSHDETTGYLYEIADYFLSDGYSQERMLGLFYLILSDIVPDVKESEEIPERVYDRKAIQYIRQNYGYDIRVSDIANYAGIDRTYLYKIFRKYDNVSPKEYLTGFRIDAAKKMLAETRLTVTEVGLSCGFHDASAFGKNFMKYQHVTPREYRRKVLGDFSNETLK